MGLEATTFCMASLPPRALVQGFPALVKGIRDHLGGFGHQSEAVSIGTNAPARALP